MKSTRSARIIFWITTSILFIWEGLLPAFTSNSELAIRGMRHLGYPDYFRIMLSVFKVAGAIVLIVPVIPARLKEWAYAGFGITMVAAFVSYCAVDGFSFAALFPLFFFGILIVSYVSWQKIKHKPLTRISKRDYSIA
jgi:hypothetical protein